MATFNVPEPDNLHPRWLLNLDKWSLSSYHDVEDEVKKQGYGIVSYTWGRVAVPGKTAPNPPKGLQWDVPLVKSFTLEEAKAVMMTMGKTYVWWDWMCVPQGDKSKMSPELKRIQAEELQKQMNIYKGAQKSIVWVHDTKWNGRSDLESFLKGRLHPEKGLPAYLNEIVKVLKACQEHEPWLTSGWTLQEGVLLSETLLLDHEGKTLRDDRFMHHDGQACVIDLTSTVTRLAIGIATAFIRHSDGDAGDDQTEIGRLVKFISNEDDKNYPFTAGILATILKTGLVAYAKHSPLYILAGKQSRKFTVSADQCWALLGALELEAVDVSYDLELKLIKERFFKALLEQYQWTLFLIPAPPPQLGKRSWSEVIVDGYFLPLGIFFDANFVDNLPTLFWSPNGLAIGSSTTAPFPVFSLNESVYARRYEQQQTGEVFVVGVSVAVPSPKAKYLQVADLESRNNIPGKRCILITDLRNKKGYFGGLVDIWADETSISTETFDEIALSLPEKAERVI